MIGAVNGICLLNVWDSLALVWLLFLLSLAAVRLSRSLLFFPVLPQSLPASAAVSLSLLVLVGVLFSTAILSPLIVLRNLSEDPFYFLDDSTHTSTSLTRSKQGISIERTGRTTILCVDIVSLGNTRSNPTARTSPHHSPYLHRGKGLLLERSARARGDLI